MEGYNINVYRAVSPWTSLMIRTWQSFTDFPAVDPLLRPLLAWMLVPKPDLEMLKLCRPRIEADDKFRNKTENACYRGCSLVRLANHSSRHV